MKRSNKLVYYILTVHLRPYVYVQQHTLQQICFRRGPRCNYWSHMHLKICQSVFTPLSLFTVIYIMCYQCNQSERLVWNAFSSQMLLK